jgi:hypothetical protein
MISGQPRPIRTETEDRDPTPRLEMKPPDAPRGHVDGGWWPRSSDPAAEFPALIAALSSRVGPVNRVSYHLDSWGVVARKVSVAGRPVRFEGFHSMDPHTVVVIGTDSRRVNLLVVPSDVVGGVARAVLRAWRTYWPATAWPRPVARTPLRSCHTPDRPNRRRRSTGRPTAAMPTDSDRWYRVT